VRSAHGQEAAADRPRRMQAGTSFGQDRIVVTIAGCRLGAAISCGCFPAMTVADNAKTNLSEKIYLDLRLRLIVGDLAPGTSLSIRTLAEEANLSAMPVREALKRLENEKALSGSAKRAYRVPAV